MKEYFRLSKVLYSKRVYIILLIYEGGGRWGRDEQILVLEEMVCLFEKAMEGLKSAYEATEDENQKLKITGGVLVFEFVINLMKQKMELLWN